MIRNLLILLACSVALLLPAEQLTTVTVEAFTPRGSGGQAGTNGTDLAREFARELKTKEIYSIPPQQEARIAVTGSYFSYGDKNFIVLKAVSTESGEVLAVAVNGEKPFTALLAELADDLAAQIKAEGNVFLPPPQTALSAAGRLMNQVSGNRRNIQLVIQAGAQGPTVMRELARMLNYLGFAVNAKGAEPDFQLVVGGGTLKNDLPGTTAFLRMRLVDAKTKTVVTWSSGSATCTGENAAQEAFTSATFSAASDLLLKMAEAGK